MVPHKQIVEACWPILEKVGFHVTQTACQRRFVTAYQIWFRLREQQAPICQVLIDECGGEYNGKDAGSPVGQAQKIAQALGNCADIETQYFDDGETYFKDFKPSPPDCGLFRIKS
jgi:hypothetical protein